MDKKLLPLLEGWQWKAKDVDVPFTLSAGKSRVMGEAEYSGWVWSALCAFNNPDAYVQFGYYDSLGVWRTTTMRPRGLYEAGFTSPNSTGIWCSKYDTTSDIYVIAFTPTIPLPVLKKYKISVVAPGTSSVTVLNYSHLLVEIVSEETFRKSLKRALGIA